MVKMHTILPSIQDLLGIQGRKSVYLGCRFRINQPLIDGPNYSDSLLPDRTPRRNGEGDLVARGVIDTRNFVAQADCARLFVKVIIWRKINIIWATGLLPIITCSRQCPTN